MAFLNTSDAIGIIWTYMTFNITGSEFLTSFVWLAILLTFSFAFNMPLELTIPFLLPFVIIMAAYMSDWLSIAGIIFIYLAILFVSMLSWMK